MKVWFGFFAALMLLVPMVQADQPDETNPVRNSFSEPVRLKGGEALIATESPGYACPSWHDVDGDGNKDLIVGQFAGGKMKIYRNLGEGKLADGEWLMIGDKPAEVPGVW